MAPIFLATGKPKIGTFWQSIRLVVLILCIYPLSMRWNIVGTSVAVCLSIAVCTFGSLLQVVSIIKIRKTIMGEAILYPLVNTCFMLMGIILLKWKLKSVDILSFLAVIFTGGVIYFTTNYLCNRFTNFKIYDTLSDRVWFNLKNGTVRVDRH